MAHIAAHLNAISFWWWQCSIRYSPHLMWSRSPSLSRKWNRTLNWFNNNGNSTTITAILVGPWASTFKHLEMFRTLFANIVFLTASAQKFTELCSRKRTAGMLCVFVLCGCFHSFLRISMHVRAFSLKNPWTAILIVLSLLRLPQTERKRDLEKGGWLKTKAES